MDSRRRNVRTGRDAEGIKAMGLIWIINPFYTQHMTENQLLLHLFRLVQKGVFFSFAYASAPFWNHKAISLVVTHEPVGFPTEERQDRDRCRIHQSYEVHFYYTEYMNQMSNNFFQCFIFLRLTHSDCNLPIHRVSRGICSDDKSPNYKSWCRWLDSVIMTYRIVDSGFCVGNNDRCSLLLRKSYFFKKSYATDGGPV